MLQSISVNYVRFINLLISTFCKLFDHLIRLWIEMCIENTNNVIKADTQTTLTTSVEILVKLWCCLATINNCWSFLPSQHSFTIQVAQPSWNVCQVYPFLCVGVYLSVSVSVCVPTGSGRFADLLGTGAASVCRAQEGRPLGSQREAERTRGGLSSPRSVTVTFLSLAQQQGLGLPS